MDLEKVCGIYGNDVKIAKECAGENTVPWSSGRRSALDLINRSGTRVVRMGKQSVFLLLLFQQFKIFPDQLLIVPGVAFLKGLEHILPEMVFSFL